MNMLLILTCLLTGFCHSVGLLPVESGGCAIQSGDPGCFPDAGSPGLDPHVNPPAEDARQTRVDELAARLTAALDQPIKVNQHNLCSVITAVACSGQDIRVISVQGDPVYLISTTHRWWLLATHKGEIDWSESWSGDPLTTINLKLDPLWYPATARLPERVLIKGRYRDGCPDCGTQDVLFIRQKNGWQPMNLTRMEAMISGVVRDVAEWYVAVNHQTGQIKVTVAFNDFRQSQAEDLSYLTAMGTLVGGFFQPERFVASPYNP